MALLTKSSLIVVAPLGLLPLLGRKEGWRPLLVALLTFAVFGARGSPSRVSVRR
jgi:hypothetical protein